jgi:hypothetical protein
MVIRILFLSFLFATIATNAMEPDTSSSFVYPVTPERLSTTESATKKAKLGYVCPSLKECAIKIVNKPLLEQFNNEKSSEETSSVCKNWIQK